MSLNNPVAQITESGLVLTDNTTADSAVGQHGLLPKLSSHGYDFPAGDGTWRNTNAYADPLRDPFTEPVYGWTECITQGTGVVGAGPGFTALAISSGTIASIAGTGDHPGQGVIGSVAGANSGALVLNCVYASTAMFFLSANAMFEIIWKTPATQTNMLWWAGFHNSISATFPTYGTFFNVSGNQIQGTGINAGTTNTGTAGTMGNSTWYRGCLDVVSDTSATFTVKKCSDGTTLWTSSITTNAMYTTAPLNAGICAVDSAGGTHVIVTLDAMRYLVPYIPVR
jgi:hypothetical protein